MEAGTVYQNVRVLAADFAVGRRDRQQRRELVAADFARLRDAGFLLTGVPINHCGIWQSVGESARPICEMLRTLAHGDSSVALVCAMHPVVLNFWMATAQAPSPFHKAWDDQRRCRSSSTSAKGPGGGLWPRNPARRATLLRPRPRLDAGHPTARTY